MTQPLFKTVAVVGLGLIGSSILHAIRRGGLAEQTVGMDRSDDVCTRAVELDLADDIQEMGAAGAAEADLVILAVPLGAMKDVAVKLSPGLKPGTIVTDVGSSKVSVIEDMASTLPAGVHFVPGHPIAGTEQSGPDAGFPELFDGRWLILTPDGSTDKEALERVKSFWQAIGSGIEIMTAEHHDMVLAVTSHLPHLIAYNIVGTAADLEDITSSEVIKFSAAGFRDFTRLAASDPIMWRDVCLNNKDAILEMLSRFSEDLSALQRAVRWNDGEALFDLFTRTRGIRRRIIDAGQETSDPDFGRLTATATPETSDKK